MLVHETPAEWGRTAPGFLLNLVRGRKDVRDSSITGELRSLEGERHGKCTDADTGLVNADTVSGFVLLLAGESKVLKQHR